MRDDIEREIWDNFILQNAPNVGAFLQSYSWGEFQEKEGNKISRLIARKDGKWAGVMLLVKLSLPFGQSVLYAPRGPILKKEILSARDAAAISDIFQQFFAEIKKIAREEKSIFWRIDPSWPEAEELAETLLSLGFLKGRKEIQPQDTLSIDLSLSEEELLKQMKEKTRYNIRLAERRGVSVEMLETKDDIEKEFESFYALLAETAERDYFFLHQKDYYQKMLTGENESCIRLFVAKKDNRTIAGALVSFFGNTAAYLHGASSYRDRQFMAPFLLHWEIVKKAREKGCCYYDLNGVAPEASWQDESHLWHGITRFKRGFSPETKIDHFIGSWEFSLSPLKYFFYRWFQRMRR